MNMTQFILQLQAKDVRLTLNEDKLKISAPVGALTLQDKLNLKQNKNKLIAFLLDMKVASKFASLPTKKQRDGSPIALSKAQRSLWTIHKFQPSPLYNMPFSIQFKGELNVNRLNNSLAILVKRHEALRTILVEKNGLVGQIFTDSKDWSALQVKIDEKELDNYLHKRRTNIFNLITGPLFYADIIEVTTLHHVLFVNMHHIISDGWSISIFFNELSELYNSDQDTILLDLPLQFADYCEWDNNIIQADGLAQARHYWKDKLKDSPPFLNLPSTYERPQVCSHRGAIFRFDIDNDIQCQIKQISLQQGTTLFVLLLSTFKWLLAVISGQRTIIIGSPVSTRYGNHWESIFGFFVNTLVLSSHVDENSQFTSFLQSVQNTVSSGLKYREFQISELMELHSVKSNLSYNPLFQVMFDLQDNLSEELLFNGVDSSFIPQENHWSKVDLTLTIQQNSEGLAARFEYSTDLFDETFINNLSCDFKSLLSIIVKDTQQTYNTLSSQTSHFKSNKITKTDTEEELDLSDLFGYM